MAANPSIQLGTDGNWAIKEDNLLAYKKDGTRFFNKEFDFTRNTTATFVDKDGLIKVSATNTPRIDFTDDATGYLLLEPQSTNLITYSEDFSQWTTQGTITTTPSYGISPDGTKNSTRIFFSDGSQQIYKNFTSSSGVSGSIYIKGNSGQAIKFGVKGGEEIFTLNGDWQRLTTYSSSSTRLTINTYGAASTARDIEVWGAQVEEKSYSTSYIPTFGSTATRAQETCNGAGNASTFNSTEGVLYAEIAALANQANYRYIALTDGTTNNRVDILYRGDVANRITSRLIVGGAEAARFDITIDNELNYNKFALSWKQNEVKFFINGTQQGSTDTNANVPPANTLNELMFNRGDGNEQFFGKTKGVYVFNKALTDDELQHLTS